jgi:hypothetical protein
VPPTQLDFLLRMWTTGLEDRHGGVDSMNLVIEGTSSNTRKVSEHRLQTLARSAPLGSRSDEIVEAPIPGIPRRESIPQSPSENMVDEKPYWTGP